MTPRHAHPPSDKALDDAARAVAMRLLRISYLLELRDIEERAMTPHRRDQALSRLRWTYDHLGAR